MSGIDASLDATAGERDQLSTIGPDDVDPAPALSFARNVFVPLTTACRYTCSYCTYFDPPGEASLMSRDAVRNVLETGADAGCTEALFTFGDTPDGRYTDIHDQLEAWGYDSIHGYLYAMCELALDVGILPHSNPGDLGREQMARLAEVNASMGVMLETTADIDAHSGPRKKTPEQRLETIRAAGAVGIAFTTGILVGIGEDWDDRAESLLAIRTLHEQYGHIQEVIVQPVSENERWTGPTPDIETLRRAVAMARYVLPDEISVQVPPNLAPVRELLDCGVDDLGGVSPITDDHINPDYAWPALRELESIAEEGDVPLTERLPTHDHYVEGGWLAPAIERAIDRDDGAGRRYRRVLEREELAAE